MAAYVYMLRCGDNSLYTGWTTDLQKRLEKHRKGTGAKYTRAKEVLELVYYEEVQDRSAALKREYALKQLPKESKESLVSAFEARQKYLFGS